jgi:hypothetical protein
VQLAQFSAAAGVCLLRLCCHHHPSPCESSIRSARSLHPGRTNHALAKIRHAPTAQLAANDHYKRLLADADGDLNVPRRLASGAMAGMTATALTHPLDVVRLRLALPGQAPQGGCDARG